jgi:hypothetical protein
VDRLPHETEQPAADVPAASSFGERRCSYSGEAEGVVQLAGTSEDARW